MKKCIPSSVVLAVLCQVALAGEVLPEHRFLALSPDQAQIVRAKDEAAAQKVGEWPLAVPSVDIPAAWPSSTNDIYVADVYWSSYCLVRELDPKAVFTVPATLCSDPKLSLSVWERMPINCVTVLCRSDDREAPSPKFFLDRGFRVRLDGKDIPVKTTPSLGAEIALELTPTPENPRNSEGDFVWLNDGTLLFAWSRFYQAGKHENGSWDNGGADIACRRSTDGGRTWGEKDEILVRNTAMNLMSVSFLRLADGRIALFYIEKESPAVYKAMMRTSSDEAKTWSDAVEVTACLPPGMYVLNNARVIQLGSGRLLVPVAWHLPKPEGGHTAEARLACLRSDDAGATWTAGAWADVHDGEGRRVVSQEPGVVELKDGRVMMWTRTDARAQYAGYSSDGGVTWSAFGPTELAGPRSPATIERLKTGELIAVWNDHRGHDERGGIRAPLSIALSRDDGRTWSPSVSLEENLTDFLCYTAFIESGDDLLFAYCTKRERNLDTLRLTRVPRTALPSSENTMKTALAPGWSIACGRTGDACLDRIMKETAEELARDIREATGLELSVVVETGKAPSPAILLGAEFARAAGLMPRNMRNFDNVIAERDGDIYLFGVDAPGRDPTKFKMSYQFYRLPTVKAATRFLETYCGVRFLQPGLTGTAVRRQARIAVEAGLFSRENPRQEFSTGRLHTMFYDIANNMFGFNAYNTYGGHTYPRACPAAKYFKDHPEYFALISGVRVADPVNPSLCISNPDVERLIIEELLRNYDLGAEVCELGQQDGFRGCECKNCRAYAGSGSWCEKLWLFHAGIARKIEKLRPGKKVLIISYGPTVPPPQGFRTFPDNVMVEVCHGDDARFSAFTGEWRAPQGITTYTYLWGSYPRPGYTPKLNFARAALTARRFFRYGVKGMYRCGFGELFGLDGPAYYVFNRVLERPEADVGALVGEYCDWSYGAAADLMRRFHDALDRRLQVHGLIEEGWPADAGKGLATYRNARDGSTLDLIAYIYTPEVVRTMEGLLVRAEGTPGLGPKERRRLALVRLEWDYARRLGEIATLYAAYRMHPTRESFAPVAAAVKARNAWLDGLYSGTDGKPRGIEGWPELRVFHNDRRSRLDVNGTLAAITGAPLGWDVSFLEANGLLPGAAVKRTTVGRAAAKPSGADFESGEWAKAKWQDLAGSQLQRIGQKARFKVLRDDRALYIACESDLADDYPVKRYGRDAKVWYDESHDLLLDPTGTRDRYYHLVWGPEDGSYYDSAFGLVEDPLDPKYNHEDVAWNGEGWVFHNKRTAGTWRTMVEIPFAMLGVPPPAKGEVWCANVGREWNHAIRRQKPIVGALWSPNLVTKYYTAPEAMGELVFE